MKHYRIIEKREGIVLADWDGNILQPEHAQQLARSIISTAQNKSYVYIGLRESDGLYKIGRTKNLDRRLSELGIKVVHTIECPLYGDRAANVVEAALHRMFKAMEFHVKDEWFSLGPAEVELLQRQCENAADALDLVEKLPKALNEIERVFQEVKSRVHALIIVRLIHGVCNTEYMYPALCYDLRAMYYACKKSGNKLGEGHAQALIYFIAEWNKAGHL